MAELWKQVNEALTGAAGKLTAYTALGSFALYVLGYLTLRFQLTAFGIGTDLDVLDERYLFAGSRFLVYLVSSVPTVLLFALLLAVLFYVPYRCLPGGSRTRLKSAATEFASHPNRLALMGIVLSLALIQFVARQCFAFSNLLLANSLPGPHWLQTLFLSDEADGLKPLYFSGLIAGTFLTGTLLLAARKAEPPASNFLVGLLIFLLAVQFLLLPVNYGILIASPELPRVADLGGKQALNHDQQAWLVWEGKAGVTYLVRTSTDRSRKLVTLQRTDVKAEITGYDPVFQVLFKAPNAARPAMSDGSTR